MLSDADQKHIEEAVARAEGKTTGEIVCIVARSVSTYPEIALAWAAAGALLLPALLVWIGMRPAFLVEWMHGWSASAGSTHDPVILTIAGYAIVQAAIFLALAFIVSVPAVRTFLTPTPIKKQRVHQAAYEQFLATGIHQSEARTGVVIFVCLEDRCVSVIADELIHRIVGNEIWSRAVAAVETGMRMHSPGAGLVQAVEICGAALAKHFPGKSANILADKPLTM